MKTLASTPYAGAHCESTALVNMLRNRSLDISETMVFGLGEGLSFVYWHSKQMPVPFLGGRIKPDQLMRNAGKALGIDLITHETASPKRAEAALLEALDEGDVVALKLDRHHLEYAHEDFHFAAHYVACLGYAEDRFTLCETAPLGIQTTSRESMATARAARGPMSSRSLSLRLGGGTMNAEVLPQTCREAIRRTATDFLNPPITNVGFKGIVKTSRLMRSWAGEREAVRILNRIGNSMEDGGTGGGFFRAMWARFLEEASSLTGIAAYSDAAGDYHQIAARWTEVANLLRHPDPSSVDSRLAEASEILSGVAVQETRVMADLESASR